MSDLETPEKSDLDKWKDIVRTSKTSWILLHLYGRGDLRSLQWTLEDYKLAVERSFALDILYEEINARIPPRGPS